MIQLQQGDSNIIIVPQGGGTEIKMRLLIVEDEVRLNKTLTERLTKRGYSVDSCYDGEAALYYINSAEYDGIVLDVMIPKINGFEVLKTIRERKIQTPVLMLTAKDSDEDIISGLDNGANDYLTKPFSFDVLCARIRAMCRIKDNITDSTLKAGDLTVDLSTRIVRRGDNVIELSAKEYSILEYLLLNKNIVISKEKLEEHIWNYDYEGGSNVIKVYIHHLRKKIDEPYEKKLLHTIKNSGYVIKDL